MGLLSKLKTIFNKNKQINTKDTTIVPYDTSLVTLPKYKELSKEEQEEVEKYKQEIKSGDISSLILYAGQLSEYANVNVTLLTKVYFKLTNQPTDWQLEKMDLEEIMRMRLEAKVNKEELQIYLAGLKKLEQESILRAVAVEEVRKQENKRKFEFLGLFSQAERMHRKNQLEQISSAKERMLITVKTMEQLMQAVNNTIGNEEKIETAIDIYNVVLKSKMEKGISKTGKNISSVDIVRSMGADYLLPYLMESARKKALIQKLEETSELAELIFQEKEGTLNSQEIREDIDINDDEVEAKFVRKIARMQRKITVYAHTHKQDVEKLREQLDNIIKINVIPENKEQLLKRISNIQKLYQVFQETIKEEDLGRLYKTKFAILLGDINRREDNPIEQVKDKQELEYYAKIIESKIENILLLKNPEFDDWCDIHSPSEGRNSKKVEKILEAFKRIVKSKSGNFSGDKILQDKRILGLIVAFDTMSGMREFLDANYFKRTDTKYVLRDSVYQWNEKLPLRTVVYLDIIAEKEIENLKEMGQDTLTLLDLNSRFKKDSLLNDFKLLCDSYFRDMDFKLLVGSWLTEKGYDSQSLRLPEGIRGIGKSGTRLKEDINVQEIYEYALTQKIECCKSLELPSSMKCIGCGVFISCDFDEVKLNEGLEEIGYRAFDHCKNIEEVVFPKTLKKIDRAAFNYCPGLKRIVINDEIEEIGKGAFYNTENLECLSIPSHRFVCTEMFENDRPPLPGKKPIGRYGMKNKIILEVRGKEVPECILKEFKNEAREKVLVSQSFDGECEHKEYKDRYVIRYREIEAIVFKPKEGLEKKVFIGDCDFFTADERIGKVQWEYRNGKTSGEIEYERKIKRLGKIE